MEDNNESYNPVEQNFYNYKGISTLYQTYDEYLDTNKNVEIAKVNFCAYQVINDGKIPFLQFLLINNFFNQSLSFLPINLNNMKFVDNEKLMDYYKNYMINFLKIENNSTIDDSTVDFKGFYVMNNEMYIFLDITKCKLMLNDISKDSILWFALVDEIVNTKNLSGIPIDSEVTDFFTLNSEFLFLYDKNNKKYEIPVVSYVCKTEYKTNFTYMFGVSSNKIESIFGPYYYFTNYENCLKQIQNSNKSKMGLIRFALFLNKTKVIQNLPEDIIDKSDIKQQLLVSEELDINYERLTMRISDYDGNWSLNYDSIVAYDVYLDDGKLMKDTPIICIKLYEQQYPLSYHFVSTKQKEGKNICIL
jgi:hypothetical protein